MIIDMLKRHEGLRLKPYRDTVGKLTIGYGRNLDDEGIRAAEAETMLRNDVADLAAALQQVSIHAPAWGATGKVNRILAGEAQKQGGLVQKLLGSAGVNQQHG